MYDEKNETVEHKLEEDEKEADTFLDVVVHLKHLSVDTSEKENEEVLILQIGPSHPVQPQKSKQTDQIKNVPAKREKEKGKETKLASGQPKRGQQAKQKKIKNEYKDQDKEEREMRLKLL